MFSLRTRKLTEQGAEFQGATLTAQKHLLTPEKAIGIRRISALISLMAFDECIPNPATEEYKKDSMRRTLLRCWRPAMAVKSETIRRCSASFRAVCMRDSELKAKATSAMGLPGNAIGGLSVGSRRRK